MPKLQENANSLTQAIASNDFEKLEQIFKSINNSQQFLDFLTEDDETGFCPALYVASPEMVVLLSKLGLVWETVSEAKHFRNAIGSRSWKVEELPIVEALIKEGVDINEPDAEYNYPLTAQNELQVVKVFVRDFGARLTSNTLNKYGLTISGEWKSEKKKVLRAWSKQYLAEFDEKKRKLMLEDRFQPTLD